MSALADYGRQLARNAPPLTDEQAMEFARIFLSGEPLAA